jgi:hypothetical protein
MMVLFLSSLIAVESEPSDVVGFVKYECIVTSTTNANMVSVVLDNGVTTAQDLAAEIGAPGIVDAVSKWDATTQSWEQVAYSFSPVPPPGGWAWSGNFNIVNGDVLQINVTQDVDYFCAGALQADPVYNLITTATTNANMVMLPLTKSSLTTAQDLASDIGSEGVVDAISRWVASSQSWEQVAYSFSPVPPPGGWAWSGDFDIEIGESYQISVTVPATWPSRNFRDNNSFNQNIINNTRK